MNQNAPKVTEIKADPELGTLTYAELRELVDLDWALRMARRANKVEEEAELEYRITNKVIFNLDKILQSISMTASLVELLGAVPDANVHGYANWKDYRRQIMALYEFDSAGANREEYQ